MTPVKNWEKAVAKPKRMKVVGKEPVMPKAAANSKKHAAGADVSQANSALQVRADKSAKVAQQIVTEPYEFPEWFKPPKTVAGGADDYYLTRERRLSLQKEVDKIQETETVLKAWLIQELPKGNASGVAGKVARVSVVVKDIPRVEDWSKLYAAIAANYAAHAKKHDGLQDTAFALLNRAVAAAEVKQLWKDGKTVSGVGVFHRADLSVGKV